MDYDPTPKGRTSETVSEPVKSIDWSSPETIGAAWIENSSLERWFPFSAEELTTLKAKLAEVEEQLVEAKMAVDFANAACDLKDKRLAEYEAVHAWCDKNVDRIDLYRNPDRVCVELWENLSTVPSFTAPTLYEALQSAWEAAHTKGTMSCEK